MKSVSTEDFSTEKNVRGKEDIRKERNNRSAPTYLV